MAGCQAQLPDPMGEPSLAREAALKQIIPRNFTAVLEAVYPAFIEKPAHPAYALSTSQVQLWTPLSAGPDRGTQSCRKPEVRLLRRRTGGPEAAFSFGTPLWGPHPCGRTEVAPTTAASPQQLTAGRIIELNLVPSPRSAIRRRLWPSSPFLDKRAVAVTKLPP